MTYRILPAFLSCACAMGASDTDAIEITGYLDASRISFTTTDSIAEVEASVVVVGEPGAAASTDGPVTVSNGRSDAMVEGEPGADGSFVLELPALSGDQLEVAQGATAAVAIDIVELDPFPELAHSSAHYDADFQVALVELEFVEPQSLSFVMEIHQGAVARMTGHGDTHQLFAGELHAAPGDQVLVHGLDVDHHPTGGFEVQVP